MIALFKTFVDITNYHRIFTAQEVRDFNIIFILSSLEIQKKVAGIMLLMPLIKSFHRENSKIWKLFY